MLRNLYITSDRVGALSSSCPEGKAKGILALIRIIRKPEAQAPTFWDSLYSIWGLRVLCDNDPLEPGGTFLESATAQNAARCSLRSGSRTLRGRLPHEAVKKV